MDKKLSCITHLLQINKIEGKQEAICCIEVVHTGVELQTGEEFSSFIVVSRLALRSIQSRILSALEALSVKIK
jgi:hypothetical protein